MGSKFFNASSAWFGAGGFSEDSSGGGALDAPTLEWDAEADDLTPDFAIDFPDPMVGDVVTMRRDTDIAFGSPEDATDTIDSIAPVNALAFDFGGNWTADTWYVKVFYTRDAVDSTHSNTETLTLTASSYTPTFHFVGF